MPEAGRRVKCSETHSPFFRTSYPYMQTPRKRTLYPTQIYLTSFLLYFFFALLWPSCKGNLGERSSPYSTPCPTYQVCKSQNILTTYYSVLQTYWYIVRLHSHFITGWFHQYLTQLVLQAQAAINVTLEGLWNGTLKLISHAWV